MSSEVFVWDIWLSEVPNISREIPDIFASHDCRNITYLPGILICPDYFSDRGWSFDGIQVTSSLGPIPNL